MLLPCALLTTCRRAARVPCRAAARARTLATSALVVRQGGRGAPLLAVPAQPLGRASPDQARALPPPSATAPTVAELLLPAGFPATVAPSYRRYALLSFCAATASAAGGVLATQCLLTAVGVGQSAALPTAAALNWVLKDGLGQVGGVAYAALIGNRFDADPRRWRVVAALVLDLSTAVEILTPLQPHLFLPLAALANFGKNVAWLSASATRAGLHQALATRGNLADLTAKAGSQSIAASAIGTALGIALSTHVGSAPLDILAAFSLISALHLSGVVLSLSQVALPTLSVARCDLACDENWARRGVESGAREREGEDDSVASVRNPSEVARIESFVLPPQRALVGSTVGGRRCRIRVGGHVERLEDFARCAELCGTLGAAGDLGPESSYELEPASNYVLGAVDDGNGATVLQLHFLHSASWRDVLTGYFHAMRLRALCEANPAGESWDRSGASERRAADLALSRAWVVRRGPALMRALDGAGWWVGTPLVDLAPQERLAMVRA